MSYRRETETLRERQHAAALAEDTLRYWATALVRGQFGGDSGSADYVERLTREVMAALRRDARRYAVTADRLDGVETRHGRHSRYVKLRHGRREAFGHVTEWFVVETDKDFTPGGGMETDLTAEVLAEWQSDDWRGREVREEVRCRLDREVAKLVQDRFGVYPESYGTGMPEVSPSGRWFGHVYWRQVGRQVLVKWSHSLDC